MLINNCCKYQISYLEKKEKKIENFLFVKISSILYGLLT